jgi:hypothetical protein
VRRNPSHIEHRDPLAETGGATPRATSFDAAYRNLVTARIDYDRYAGDTANVPELARASRRLAEARAAMAARRAI